MDLQLPGMGGVEAITQIRQQDSDARVIVLTTYDGDEDIFRALQAGARGYLLKGMPFDELLQSIYAVHGGESRIPMQVAEKLAERDQSEQLSPYQRQRSRPTSTACSVSLAWSIVHRQQRLRCNADSFV